MRLLSTVLTLFLIMDPLGNVPVFLSVLKAVAPERRRRILLREILIAYFILLLFLLGGGILLTLLHLQRETLGIGGGIVLFLIALRMIFPTESGVFGNQPEGEPLVVPLAVPLIVGPSTLTSLLLLQGSGGIRIPELTAAMTIAWALGAVILLASPLFYRLLGDRGLSAMERLMGMLLVMLAVQMFLNGLQGFLHR